MKQQQIDTLPMFDIDSPVKKTGEPTGRRSSRKAPNPDAIRWTSYKGAKRIPCDTCLADLIPTGGGIARDAKYKRIQHGRDELLCTLHAQLRREIDGFEPLKQV